MTLSTNFIFENTEVTKKKQKKKKESQNVLSMQMPLCRAVFIAILPHLAHRVGLDTHAPSGVQCVIVV